MNPSQYQKDICDHVENGTGNAAVNAVAGSGKTTSLYLAAQKVRANRAMALAFNKSIAVVMGEKFKGTTVKAKTNHALGYGILAKELEGRLQVEDRKYRRIIKERHFEAHRDWKDLLYKYVHYCRVTLTDATNIAALIGMALHYGLASRPALTSADEMKIANRKISLTQTVPAILAEGENEARADSIVDFTDMLYLPWKWDLHCPKYQYIFVDECQDLSALQLAIIQRCSSGRILAVGDPAQSVFGFAGASSDSFDQVIAATSAVQLPLSICYRCPTSHLKLAREIVPHIESAPGAEEGILDTILEHTLVGKLEEQDLILCRTTAPLVKLCIKLISNRVPASVKGRDIGVQLVTLAKKATEEIGFSYEEFPEFLNDYCHRRLAIYYSEDKDSLAELLLDQREALVTIYEEFSSPTFDGFCNAIQDLFSDRDALIQLSTVHRAKGLEADRVFILCPEKLPLIWKNQKEWQYEQEMNLKYVALTRAKKALYFVESYEGE